MYNRRTRTFEELKMKSVPNRITAISYDQVAVVLHNEGTIEILNTRDELSYVRSLKTDGNCVDVEYFNTKLYESSPFADRLSFKSLT